MLKSQEAIAQFKKHDYRVLKQEKWLRFLALTKERNINLERVNSLEDLQSNYVLSYVEKTLTLLDNCQLDDNLKTFAEETLKWAEVAKGGLPHQRKAWIQKGYQLYAHNEGSAQIYSAEANETDPQKKRIVSTLIATHGLIGQYLRGEVPLSGHKPLYSLVQDQLLSASDLRKILFCLNFCIISGVEEELWATVAEEVKETIEVILSNNFDKQKSIKERLKALRTVSIANGENFEAAYEKTLSDERIYRPICNLLEGTELWYVEAALFDFSFEEFIKIFLMIAQSLQGQRVRHISFEKFMKELYYQHNGQKRVNIYKKRIIEKYLSALSMDDILQGNYQKNLHVTHEIYVDDHLGNIVLFNFRFSKASSKLIEFCVEAEKIRCPF